MTVLFNKKLYIDSAEKAQPRRCFRKKVSSLTGVNSGTFRLRALIPNFFSRIHIESIQKCLILRFIKKNRSSSIRIHCGRFFSLALSIAFLKERNLDSFKIFLFTVLTNITVLSVASVNAVDIYGAQLSSLIELGGNGKYQQVMRRITNNSDFKVGFYVYPPKRATIAYESQKDGCAFPSSVVKSLDEGQIWSTQRLSKAQAQVFSFKKEINSIQELSQLSFSYVRGVLVSQNVLRLKKGLAVNSEEQSYKLLLNNRVDAIVAWVPDILGILPVDRKIYTNPNFLIDQVEDKLVCYKNAVNQRFIDFFDHRVKQLKQNGELKKILGKLYLP